jgi:hypothetical protein
MDYSVGSHVRVKLYSGKMVEAEITAITNQSAGRKVQIVCGSVTASINPEADYESSADHIKYSRRLRTIVGEERLPGFLVVDEVSARVAPPVFLSDIPLQTQGAENFQAILAHRAFLGTSLGSSACLFTTKQQGMTFYERVN